MKKLCLLLVLAMLLAMPVSAAEEGTVQPTQTPATEAPAAENRCGEDLTWSIEGTTLTISGSGKMEDFTDKAPWDAHREEIIKVVFSGVTYIGARAFTGYELLEYIDFGDQLQEIGQEAFASCTALNRIQLPASFKVFGPSAFRNCTNLKEIHCEGRFPSFRQNCLTGVSCTIYYPAQSPWGEEYIQQLEEAFHGRIQFLDSDGVDQTPAPTEHPATEEPTQPPTTPPTQAPTLAPTEEPTVPVTELPTQAATLEAATEVATDPVYSVTEPAQEQAPESGSWIGLVIVGLVLALIATGAVVFGGTRKKGKFSQGRRR